MNNKPRGRPKEDRDIGPTKELIAMRAADLARVIAIHPMGLAKSLAEQQNAGTYLGRLYLINVITHHELEAARQWKGIVDQYARLLMVPKSPGSIDMTKREPSPSGTFENAADEARFKRVKRQYEVRWDAVADHGVAVLRATTGALRDEETPVHLLRPGLLALVAI